MLNQVAGDVEEDTVMTCGGRSRSDEGRRIQKDTRGEKKSVEGRFLQYATGHLTTSDESYDTLRSVKTWNIGDAKEVQDEKYGLEILLYRRFVGRRY